MIKIVIVDDHLLFREGIKGIIDSEADMQIVGVAGSVGEVVKNIHLTKPDVILMDFYLPDGNGAQATTSLLSEYPGIKVLFLSISGEVDDLLAAIRSGAEGYLLKNEHPAKLIEAIRSVYEGKNVLSPTVAFQVVKELVFSDLPMQPTDPKLVLLTEKERDILSEIKNGKDNQEIAEKLVLSVNSVKFYIDSILAKLNVPDRKAAMDFSNTNDPDK